MKGLNLSKFKKVSSDKSSTMLQHSDGHSLKIAHKLLHPKMLEELNKLPIHKANGGQVKQYAEGTPDEPVSTDDTAALKAHGVNININTQPQPQPAAQQQVAPAQAPKQQQSLAPGGGLDISPVDSNDPNLKPADPAQPQPAPPQSGLAITPVPENDQEIESAPEQPTEQVNEPSGNAVPVPPEQQATANDETPQVPDLKQELSAEDKAWEQDLNNGHITPQTYSDLFAKKSTLGKIGTIFGLLLGGAGAGLTHTENPLLTMMNNEIQNDLEAQKQSKGNAQNFIRLNQQHQMNQAQIHKMVQEGQLTEQQAKVALVESETKAYTLANMQMNRAVLHKLTADMQRLPPGSLQRQQAEQSLAMMYQAVNSENFNLADRAASASNYYKMLFGQQNGQSNEQNFQKQTTGMRMLGPQGEARAKDLEEKHFPGLKGQASVPLSGEDRTSINSGIDFDQKLHRFMDWTKKHSGDLNPSDRKAGQALASELQGAYRQATHGGVYKEGEQNFISKLIDSTPTKFFNEVRVMPQLKAIAGENQARVNQLVKSKGFQGYEGAQEQGSGSEGSTIERVDPKSGRTVIYDAATKKPLRWK